MTDKEKATAVLNYLEETDSTTVINILNALIKDEQLAGVYDNLVKEGILEKPEKIKLIAIYFKSDECYERLTDEYQNFDLDSFVARVKFLFPEIIREDDVEEIEGEIQNENERYILTWEDAIEECVRIYEKM